VRKEGVWVPIAILTAVVIGIGGLYAFRLGTANRQLAFALESERQRNFSDMVYHVEQIQALLSKGLVAGTVGQNMRFMGDVHEHTVAAVANFSTLPLPAELNVNTGKFLQQTGDVAVSVLRNEAAGRPMDDTQRAKGGPVGCNQLS
jgi:germination protein YpeB